MNQLRAWLYGRDSSYRREDTHKLSHSVDETSSEMKVHKQENGRLFESQAASTSQQLRTKVRSAILSVIPLAPGDCLECKLVGTGVMVISGIIVLYSALTSKHRNRNLSGLPRTMYYTLCGGLFIGFETTAACRLFDWGPFRKAGSKTTNS